MKMKPGRLLILIAVIVCGKVDLTSGQASEELVCFVTPALLELKFNTIEILCVEGDEFDVTCGSRDNPEIYTDGNIVEFSDGTANTEGDSTVEYLNVTLTRPKEVGLQGAIFGVHFCDAFSTSIRSRARFVLHNQDILIPKGAIRTHIVSVGDSLRLCVESANIPKSWKGPIEWAFNGKQPRWLRRWTGSPCIRINSVDACQAGVYEAYRRICGRHGNQHAFFDVKVRVCPNGFYEPSGCVEANTNVCQTGYPSDVADECVCANGFAGSTCNTATEGQFHINGENVLFSNLGLHSTGRGSLMCTEDTGCTCTPGWKGIRCDEACDSLSFGPDCTERCAGGTPCNRFTGQP